MAARSRKRATSVDDKLTDAIALLALTAVDVNRVSSEVEKFENGVRQSKEMRRSLEDGYESMPLEDLNRLRIRLNMPPVKYAIKMAPLEKISHLSDEEFVNKTVSPNAYAPHARNLMLLQLINRLAHPLLTSPPSPATILDREKIARDALANLTRAERAIQIRRYCYQCGYELDIGPCARCASEPF